MRKFGVIYPGKGERDPRRQRERLEEYGVPATAIGTEDEIPPPREGDVVIVDDLVGLGDDPAGEKAPYPHFLASRYQALTGGVRPLHVRETRKEYLGLGGLVALIWDWTETMRRGRTANARKTGRGPAPLEAPKFYLALSPGDKGKLRRQFEAREIDGRKASVEDIARHWKTSKASVERCAKAFNWTRPSGAD